MPSPLNVENVMRTQTVRDYLQATYGYVEPKPATKKRKRMSESKKPATKKRMSEIEFWNRLLRELETDPDEELRRRHRADRGRKRMQDLADKLQRASTKRSYGGFFGRKRTKPKIESQKDNKVESQTDRILRKSREVQALNAREQQHDTMMSHGLEAGYFRFGPNGIPIHRDNDLVWDSKTRMFVDRDGQKRSDSAYSDLP